MIDGADNSDSCKPRARLLCRCGLGCFGSKLIPGWLTRDATMSLQIPWSQQERDRQPDRQGCFVHVSSPMMEVAPLKRHFRTLVPAGNRLPTGGNSTCGDR